MRRGRRHVRVKTVKRQRRVSWRKMIRSVLWRLPARRLHLRV